MDLEALSKNLGSMDAQNITSLLLSLIAQLGGRRGRKRPTETDGMFLADTAINQSSTMVDDTETLAHNLTTILMKNYMNDSALWNAIAVNLENEEVRWKEEANRRLSHVTAIIIIVFYTCVIAIGSFGNLLVVSAVARQPSLRTPRNVFIINLAVSDLLLCLVTMPLTLVEMVNDHWPLGDSVVSCKVAGGLQAVSVFVSTLSITAIALDRYQLIVYPTKDILKTIGAAVGLGFIWMLGFLLASPIFIFRTLEHHDLNSPNKRRAEAGAEYSGGVHSIDYCYEKWPVSHGRAIYSACTLLIQYVLPILIISFLHSQICQRLRNRHSTIVSMRSQQETERQAKEAKRLRRRHHLLMTIALVFSITWLPLNVLNLVLDLYNPHSIPLDEETMLIIYAACHLFGMSSACANPFFYGWFNDNFRNEFMSMLTAPVRLCFGSNNCGRSSCCCCCPSTSRRMLNAGVVRSGSSSPVDDASGKGRFDHQETKIDIVEGSTVISGALWQPMSSTTEEQIMGDDHHQTTATPSLPVLKEEVIVMEEISHSFDAGSSRANDDIKNSPASVLLSSKPLFETHL